MPGPVDLHVHRPRPPRPAVGGTAVPRRGARRGGPPAPVGATPRAVPGAARTARPPRR
ncbi:hypothetical protein NKH77_03825 [Streptomyces sp. M19]